MSGLVFVVRISAGIVQPFILIIMRININVIVAVKVYRFVTKYSLAVNALHIPWREIFVTLVNLLFHK